MLISVVFFLSSETCLLQGDLIYFFFNGSAEPCFIKLKLTFKGPSDKHVYENVVLLEGTS